jgi:NAD(P)H-hydrate epimerase
MATGGQGDLLSGLLASLLAGGLSPIEAARAGAWLAGRSAELALQEGGQSEESLVPTDLAEWLGGAFRDLREAN